MGKNHRLSIFWDCSQDGSYIHTRRIRDDAKDMISITDGMQRRPHRLKEWMGWKWALEDLAKRFYGNKFPILFFPFLFSVSHYYKTHRRRVQRWRGGGWVAAEIISGSEIPYCGIISIHAYFYRFLLVVGAPQDITPWIEREEWKSV